MVIGFTLKNYLFPSVKYEDSGLLGFISITLVAFFSIAFNSFHIIFAFMLISAIIGLVKLYRCNIDFSFIHLKNTKQALFIGLGTLFSILVVSNYQNSPTSIFDTGAYHVVIVKWLREYGFVKGIANLDPTYGFLSPFFFSGAIFEHFIWDEKSWQLINGIIFLLHLPVVIRLIMGKKDVIEWGILFGYLLSFYYSRFYLPSISPDFWVSLAIPYSILLFYEHYKYRETDNLTWLLGFCLFTFWVKLSAVVLLILPVTAYILNLYYDNTIRYSYLFTIGFIVIGQMVYTNIITTGYLFYPLDFTKLDVQWAVPVATVQNLTEHIYLWGIDPSYSKDIDYSGYWWLKNWAERNINPGLYLHEFIAFFSVPVTALSWFFYSRRTKLFGLFINLVFVSALIFWFVNSPNPRFIRPWIWTIFGINCIACMALIFQYAEISLTKFNFLFILISIYLMIPMAIESGIRKKLIQDQKWITTYKTPKVDFDTLKLKSGQIIHIPSDNCLQPWYIPLPSSRQWPVNATGTIKKGFSPVDTATSNYFF